MARTQLSQRIRLRFSGLTIFASKVLSIITGFIFVITVTRNISSSDFGVWQNIGDMVSYFVIFSGVIPGWATRSIARGHKNAEGTVVLTNLMVSLPFIAAWVFLAPNFAKIAGSYTNYYLLAALMVLGSHLKPALEGVAQASRPHLLGIDLVVHELTLVSVGVSLVKFLGLGLFGALITTIVSNFVDVLFYLVSLRNDLGIGIEYGYVRNWFRASIVNIYALIGDKLNSLSLIILVLYSGVTARAYVGAANTIALTILYATSFTVGLYPKLLAGGQKRDVEVVTKLVFMFAIPMVVGTLVLASPLLMILNPVYGIATPVLCLFALSFLAYSLSAILDTIITGTEKVDDGAFRIKDIMKSRLLLPSSLSYVSAAITLPLLYFLLTSPAKPTSIDGAVYYVAVGYASIPIWLTVKYLVARKCVQFELPLKAFAKYTIASGIMAVVLLSLSVAPRISVVFGAVGLGGVLYFAVLLIIDNETRGLFRDSIRVLKSKKMNAANM